MKIIITESQLKSLILEQQKIKVTDKCGKTQEFDYQQWYYNGGQTARSDLKCYTWDGKSYVYNYSCHFKNWTSMTKEQRDTAIAGVRRTCVGSYKEQPNLISYGINEVKNIVFSLANIDNILFLIGEILKYVPPPFGGKDKEALVKLIEGISFIVRWRLTNDISEKAGYMVSLFFVLCEYFNVSPITVLPSFIQKIVKKIYNYIGKLVSGEVAEELVDEATKEFLNSQVAAESVGIVALVGETYQSLLEWFLTNVLIPLQNAISKLNTSLSTYITDVTNYIKNIISNAKQAKKVVNIIKKTDPNFFTQ